MACVEEKETHRIRERTSGLTASKGQAERNWSWEWIPSLGPLLLKSSFSPPTVPGPAHCHFFQEALINPSRLLRSGLHPCSSLAPGNSE